MAPAASPSAVPEGPPSPREVAGVWAKHLLAFWFPGHAFLFLATGPHAAWWAWIFLVPLVVAHAWDTSGRVEPRQPRDGLPDWPFDALVYALAALQLVNVALLVGLVHAQGFLALDFLVGLVVVGASSGHSIITAHELIHRRTRWERLLGRALLCSVLYEHFYTEHIRGHHARVGTPEDPATARFGEPFQRFYLRTVPAQLQSAWRLERQRLLGDPDASSRDRRLLGSRVLHGLLVEWGVALAVAALYGAAAFAIYVLQALFATRLLEIVNYFEHWGLRREGRRVTPSDSWDTHSWFTYYSLIGLSRHADHHARAARPYQRLRVHEEAPILPAGYVGLIPMVVLDNRRFRRLAAEELRRRRLGPFREGAGEGASAPADEAARAAAG